MDIDVKLVGELVDTQFPKWANLTIKPVKHGGNDNRTFHLGEEMAVRLPSHKHYEPQVEKEAKWLPKLAPHLSLPITVPMGKGKPTKDYPYVWSINKWIDGDTVTQDNVDLNQFAWDLAKFLKELESIDASEGPRSGAHNFYRGGDLSVYDSETQEALDKLEGKINVKKCKMIWEQALLSKWVIEPVWVHGDIAPGNLLVQNGHLTGVIDFGILGTGDPSCDLSIAWTFFDKSSRRTFMESMDLDKETWKRAKGWALWKALITYENKESRKVVETLMNES
ncbi:aminoglycoside phosphotransferase family protein [Sporosarcina sp. ANT_H38]|nr:aminoglycoside phosphotransferase family protein [Sporosarcina sp. ANT_H38]